MGLDCTAYERIELLPPHERSEGCEGTPEEKWHDYHLHAYVVDDSFRPAFRGLEHDRCYVYRGETMGIHAGAYSAYNRWRDQLSTYAIGVPAAKVWEAPDRYSDKGFVELINFSDCEGSIGPDACAALAHDFETQRERIAEAASKNNPWVGHPYGSDYFMRKYDEFARAFRLAAGTGMVDFH